MDLNDIKLRGIPNSSHRKLQKKAGHARRLREPFVAGPIPWNWLCRASKLPGQALAIGMCLWFRKGLEKSWKVRLGRKWAKQMGIKPDSARRGLRELRVAGLVKVEQHPGRAPVVTIIYQMEERLDEPDGTG